MISIAYHSLVLVLWRSNILIGARRAFPVLLFHLSHLVTLLYLPLELILIFLLVLSSRLNNLRFISNDPSACYLVLRQRLMLGGLSDKKRPLLILVSLSSFLVRLLIVRYLRWRRVVVVVFIY
jgi:hypothetical protein